MDSAFDEIFGILDMCESMMGEKKSLVVVIVNYCRAQDTIECVESILEKNEFFYDPAIIIIDNGSEDDSYEVFEKIYKDNKQIILEQTPNNLGFTGGYNFGIRIALNYQIRWILLLNNDTVIEKQAINLLMDPQYDIIIPKILVQDKPNLVWSAGAKWRMFPPGVVIRGYLKKDHERYNKQEIIKYATGCAIMIRREALIKLGGFDEEFGSYFEDNDFFYRAEKLELKILYQPKSIIYHKISKTYGNYSKIKWFLIGRNSVLFYLKENRFSIFTLAFFAIWVIVRESIKGKFYLVPSFIRGLFEGIQQIKSKNRKLNNENM